MKIIKPSIDLDTWYLEVTCTTCKSQLGVEAKDIHYKWTKEGEYYYVCTLCDSRSYLFGIHLPPIVTADVRRDRQDPIIYVDD